MSDEDDRGEEAMEAALADVVRLHPERDLTDEDAPVSTKPRDVHCGHYRMRVELDTQLHRVICRECDKEIDPFVYLQRLASQWERYATHRKEAKRRADEAHERLKELLRLEENARARLKRIDPEAAKTAPKRPWGDGSLDF